MRETTGQDGHDRASGGHLSTADDTPTAAARSGHYDLLTAALIGAAVGISATLLIRGSRRRADPELGPAIRHAARKARDSGTRWAKAQGEALWDRVPHEEIVDAVKSYAETARDTLDKAVERELSALRKQVRRQRRRLHI